MRPPLPHKDIAISECISLTYGYMFTYIDHSLDITGNRPRAVRADDTEFLDGYEAIERIAV